MQYLTGDEIKNVCHIGEGEKCCAYLMADPDGFFCGKLEKEIKEKIDERLIAGTMVAKSEGGYPGCYFKTT